MEIEILSSAVGAVAVDHQETPVDKSCDFFQSIAGKQFLFKADIDAGQVAPHFHLHLMIETDKTENNLLNMVPLMNYRLQVEAMLEKVTQYQGILACLTS